MVEYTLWGNTVNLNLSRDTFPTDDEIKSMDENGLTSQHGFFESNRGGHKLHYRKCMPPNGVTPKGMCVFEHGIQGHGGMSVVENGERYKYALLPKLLTDAGYILYILDMYGHGFSEGERFYIPESDWTLNRDDLDSFAVFASHQEGAEQLPLFLMGESYGACLVLHVARQWMDSPEESPSNYKGICISAPGKLKQVRLKVFLKQSS